jgi:hypothetical protein
MNTTFRAAVLKAANTYLRGEIAWSTTTTKKTRGGKFYTDHTSHTCKDAILHHVTDKTVEITLPDGQTFRKLKASYGFNLYKVRPLKPKGYQILLKKRQCRRNSENLPNPLPSKSSPCGTILPTLPAS